MRLIPLEVISKELFQGTFLKSLDRFGHICTNLNQLQSHCSEVVPLFSLACAVLQYIGSLDLCGTKLIRLNYRVNTHSFPT